HNHSINVSGATDRTQYYFSAGYTDQEGMIQKNDFKRLTTRLSVDQKVNNWFSLGGSLNYTNSKNTAPNTGSLPGQGFATAGLARLGFVLAPNVAAYNADGTYNLNLSANTIGWGANRSPINFYNPAYILNVNRFSSDNDRILANAYAQVK